MNAPASRPGDSEGRSLLRGQRRSGRARRRTRTERRARARRWGGESHTRLRGQRCHVPLRARSADLPLRTRSTMWGLTRRVVLRRVLAHETTKVRRTLPPQKFFDISSKKFKSPAPPSQPRPVSASASRIRSPRLPPRSQSARTRCGVLG